MNGETTGEEKKYIELCGAKIEKIEHNGGTQYGTWITIYLDNGKSLNIDCLIDISRGSIESRLSRVVGSWGKIKSVKSSIVMNSKREF